MEKQVFFLSKSEYLLFYKSNNQELNILTQILYSFMSFQLCLPLY